MKGAPRERQLAAARGELPFSAREMVTCCFFLCHSADREIRDEALRAVRRVASPTAAEIAADPATPGQLLHFLIQTRIDDTLVVKAVLAHAACSEATLLYLASRAAAPLLHLLLDEPDRLLACQGVVAAIRANPHADEELKILFATLLEADSAPPLPIETAAEDRGDSPPAEVAAVQGLAEDETEPPPPEEEVNLSKYQQALEMGVSEKIKMALTGDKEFRTIFLKDPNKLVHGAVLKNPRITEGEVLAIAKNKASSDELIRLILLNRDWLKNSMIKTALVTHPKTPLPHALRFMSILTEKDLKVLAKSKGVSQVLVNAARRIISEKDKKGK